MGDAWSGPVERPHPMTSHSLKIVVIGAGMGGMMSAAVSYTHLRAHET
jgi:hypothetical protein